MLRITVPATSANLGAGFDSLGVALSLANVVEMDLWDRVDIRSMDETPVPFGEDNLIYQTVAEVFAQRGEPLPGLRLRQWNRIPMARGLGSSSACIVAGLLGANTLLGEPYSLDELVDWAARIEGHPDNVVPALVGGMVTAALEGEKVWQVRQPLRDDLAFVAAIPDMELKTADARAALPDQIERRDGVYNLSRTALMALSLGMGRYENLRVAAQDKLHQPYRLRLIPGAEQTLDWMEELGAYASYLSGAGSTLMAFVETKWALPFAAALQERLNGAGCAGWKVLPLSGENRGAAVTKC